MLKIADKQDLWRLSVRKCLALFGSKCVYGQKDKPSQVHLPSKFIITEKSVWFNYFVQFFLRDPKVKPNAQKRSRFFNLWRIRFQTANKKKNSAVPRDPRTTIKFKNREGSEDKNHLDTSCPASSG